MRWLKMKDAPKDSTKVLGCIWNDGEDFRVIAWHRFLCTWCDANSGEPVEAMGWQELPPALSSAEIRQRVRDGIYGNEQAQVIVARRHHEFVAKFRGRRAVAADAAMAAINAIAEEFGPEVATQVIDVIDPLSDLPRYKDTVLVVVEL